jgi:hypothetical protein
MKNFSFTKLQKKSIAKLAISMGTIILVVGMGLALILVDNQKIKCPDGTMKDVC